MKAVEKLEVGCKGVRETIRKVNTEWEKIFASNSSDMGLISRIYRKLKKTQPPKNQHPVKK
jgi:hypothetical protein